MRAVVLVPVLCGIALTAGGGVEITSSVRESDIFVTPLSGDPPLVHGTITESLGPWTALSTVEFGHSPTSTYLSVFQDSDIGQTDFWGYGSAWVEANGAPVNATVTTRMTVEFVVTEPTTVQLTGLVDQGPAGSFTSVALGRDQILFWDAGYSTPPGAFDVLLTLPVGDYAVYALADILMPYNGPLNSGEWSVHFSVVPEPGPGCLLSALGVLPWRRR